MNTCIINMCMNCGLLCPLHDSVATLLNIPRRRYLARGKDLYDYLGSKSIYVDNVVSYALHNYETKHLFATDRIKEAVIDGLEGLKLYEGKIVSYHQLPSRYYTNLYLELFEEI